MVSTLKYKKINSSPLLVVKNSFSLEKQNINQELRDTKSKTTKQLSFLGQEEWHLSQIWFYVHPVYLKMDLKWLFHAEVLPTTILWKRDLKEMFR